MKHILYCLIFIGGWSFQFVIAQEASEQENSIEVIRAGIPHDALYALEMDGDWGLAVGNFGLMLETSDGGASWKELPSMTTKALLGISKSGEEVLVSGQQGLLLKRDNSGDWSMMESGLEARLLNIAFTSKLMIAVGEFGFIGRSTDGGASWETVGLDWNRFNDEGYEPHLYDAVIQGDGTILIAGEFGLILRSTDGGKTFDAAARGEQSVFDIHMAADGTKIGYAVGQEGLVLKTSDSGLSWSKLKKVTNSNLLGVWSGHDEVVITGIRELLRSSDGGVSFSSGSNDIQIGRTWFQGVGAGTADSNSGAGLVKEESILVVGHQGTIARLTK